MADIKDAAQRYLDNFNQARKCSTFHQSPVVDQHRDQQTKSVPRPAKREMIEKETKDNFESQEETKISEQSDAKDSENNDATDNPFELD